jgi:signal transduction histidine kinase
VFDRFYRGDQARTRDDGSSSEGVGLGLSIAQWIAREHGAILRIDSRPGEGTQVTAQFAKAMLSSS